MNSNINHLLNFFVFFVLILPTTACLKQNTSEISRRNPSDNSGNLANSGQGNFQVDDNKVSFTFSPTQINMADAFNESTSTIALTFTSDKPVSWSAASSDSNKMAVSVNPINNSVSIDVAVIKKEFTTGSYTDEVSVFANGNLAFKVPVNFTIPNKPGIYLADFAKDLYSIRHMYTIDDKLYFSATATAADSSFAVYSYDGTNAQKISGDLTWENGAGNQIFKYSGGAIGYTYHGGVSKLQINNRNTIALMDSIGPDGDTIHLTGVTPDGNAVFFRAENKLYTFNGTTFTRISAVNNQTGQSFSDIQVMSNHISSETGDSVFFFARLGTSYYHHLIRYQTGNTAEILFDSIPNPLAAFTSSRNPVYCAGKVFFSTGESANDDTGVHSFDPTTRAHQYFDLGNVGHVSTESCNNGGIYYRYYDWKTSSADSHYCHLNPTNGVSTCSVNTVSKTGGVRTRPLGTLGNLTFNALIGGAADLIITQFTNNTNPPVFSRAFSDLDTISHNPSITTYHDQIIIGENGRGGAVYVLKPNGSFDRYTETTDGTPFEWIEFNSMVEYGEKVYFSAINDATDSPRMFQIQQ